MALTILAITGSARRQSTNTALLLALRDVAPPSLKVTVFALEGGQTPPPVTVFPDGFAAAVQSDAHPG